MMPHHAILNWTGRISGILVTAFFAAFFIGEGLPDILNGKGNDLLRFLPFCIPALAGFILAWFFPMRGGWVMIGGALLMAVYFFLKDDSIMAMVYGLPPLMIGLCFIAADNKELI